MRADERPSERAFAPILVALLAAVVILRMGLHAFFVPVWEGPDEPFHSSRVDAAAREPIRGSLASAPLDPGIVGSIWSHPCCPSLRRSYPCPPFGGAPASFNALAPPREQLRADGGRNPENNQPPLFYLLAGAVLAPIRAAASGSPERALLACRLLNFTLVALAIVGPLRRLARSRPAAFSLAGLLLLALPGASESLVRCANDGAVFLWSAIVMACLELATPVPASLLFLLLAAGPLLKLTALPVVAAAAFGLWTLGRRRAAVAAFASPAVALAVQTLRGWRWGGGLEVNRASAGAVESWGRVAVGFARSAYTLVKTTFWLGGWSFFRAPAVLVAVWLALIVSVAAASRRRREPRFAAAHGAGALVLIAGAAVFFVAHRRFWGEWGGVGGWYVWGWMPWIAVAWVDVFAVSKRAVPALLAATAVFAATCNVLYFRAALGLYGW